MQYIPNTIPGYAPDYFGAGKNGFQDGDAATGVQGTEIAAEVWNDWLGNLMKICELAGVATAPGQFTDLANGVLGLAAGQTVAAINADAYPIVGTDIGKLLNYGTTAGAFTSSLPDVGALPARFKVDLRCEGPYALTVNAHAGNTIEGQTSVVIYAGEVVTFVPFGTVWKAFKRRSGLYVPGWQLFLTGSSTFTVPPGVYRLTSLLWGGGGQRHRERGEWRRGGWVFRRALHRDARSYHPGHRRRRRWTAGRQSRCVIVVRFVPFGDRWYRVCNGGDRRRWRLQLWRCAGQHGHRWLARYGGRRPVRRRRWRLWARGASPGRRRLRWHDARQSCRRWRRWRLPGLLVSRRNTPCNMLA